MKGALSGIQNLSIAWTRCFIQPDSGGKDVFVHATALERAGMRGLVEGQKVRFDTQPDRRTGKIAVANIEAA